MKLARISRIFFDGNRYFENERPFAAHSLMRFSNAPGRGQRSARKVGEALGVKVATDGASPEVFRALGIPLNWAERCEDAAHVGHGSPRGNTINATTVALIRALDRL
jgi:hypothetical protein